MVFFVGPIDPTPVPGELCLVTFGLLVRVLELGKSPEKINLTLGSVRVYIPHIFTSPFFFAAVIVLHALYLNRNITTPLPAPPV